MCTTALDCSKLTCQIRKYSKLQTNQKILKVIDFKHFWEMPKETNGIEEIYPEETVE